MQANPPLPFSSDFSGSLCDFVGFEQQAGVATCTAGNREINLYRVDDDVGNYANADCYAKKGLNVQETSDMIAAGSACPKLIKSPATGKVG